GRMQANASERYSSADSANRRSYEFDILQVFINAGITNITVNEHTFENHNRAMCTNEFEAFIQTLPAKLPINISIKLAVTSPLRAGKSEMAGVEVEILKLDRQELITINSVAQ
ncbi:hypothetical protein PFISCL1PPCAC_1365, partial [Pristionchus fissidentatus]